MSASTMPASTCLFTRYAAEIRACVRKTFPHLPDEVVSSIEVTPTRDPSHGDMATNAALLMARHVGQAARALASELAELLVQIPGVASTAPAGPGFINVTLHPSVMQQVVSAVLRLETRYGECALGAGQRVNVEYVSANPTGPMHVGHCRGAVVGDALANLLEKAGYVVTREYYINDAGAQVIALTWAVYWRYLQAIGSDLSVDAFSALTPNGLQYQGAYLIPIGEALAQKHGKNLATPDGGVAPTEQWFDLVCSTALTAMMEQIRADLEALGIRHDLFTSEAEVLKSGQVDDAIAQLDAKGLLYQGVLEPPKGKLQDDWEARPQTLFKSTEFGDDTDRALCKSDGSHTYFANDIGYHARKARNSDVLIDVLGADHGGYVSRMRAAVKALTGGKVGFEVVMCQIVRILKGGEPVRMSKRQGTFVTLRDLLDEVGRDAVRFTMLTRKADAQMDFDLDAVVAQTRDNPVFYVHYAHARCRSVLRSAESLFDAQMISHESLMAADLTTLSSETERALLRRLASFPRSVEAAALHREPHRIAYYCGELAADFHALWHKGREDATLRFINEKDRALTAAKLALVASVAIVLRCGLTILGVEPVEEMR